jgi:hypothetical protein
VLRTSISVFGARDEMSIPSTPGYELSREVLSHESDSWIR